MSQVQAEQNWLSLVRDGEIIGYVRVVGAENFYIYGRFRAGPAYPRYEQALAEPWRRRDEDAGNYLDALEKIDALGLQLKEPTSGRVSAVRDFQLELTGQVHGRDGVPVEFKFDRIA